MSQRARQWLERQQQAAARRPKIRLDSCTIKASTDGVGYLVVIDGFNLHQAISPPLVSVGGVPLEAISFAGDGKQIRGVLKTRPLSEDVAVDYGFARAEWHKLQWDGIPE